MTKFRPCIDLHNGKVKQIVGASLKDCGDGLKENFVSDLNAEDFAALYRRDGLCGGHVIQLGPGNEESARAAIKAYPGAMQLGGGVVLDNAAYWLDEGASHVIVTSWLFDQKGRFQWSRLERLAGEIGKHRLVVDLSCRTSRAGWTVAMNRWQKLTNLELTHQNLDRIADYCDEFLIHAADVEGLCGGVDEALVGYLGAWSGIAMTYAGGVASMADLELVAEKSGGNLDVTVGSSLDLFGGNGIRYDSLVEWNQRGTTNDMR